MAGCINIQFLHQLSYSYPGANHREVLSDFPQYSVIVPGGPIDYSPFLLSWQQDAQNGRGVAREG